MSTMITTQAWITCEEAAEKLEVSAGTVYRWARIGKLPCWRVGKSIRIDPNDLDLMITDGPAVGPARP